VPRIMIADDRESMRSALRSLLVLRPGWVVCGEAENPKEAISKATELRPRPDCPGLQTANFRRD